MSDDLRRCLDVLAAHELVPDDALAVFVVGSMARGWANPGSDVDLVVVTEAPLADRDDCFALDVPLSPPQISTVAFAHQDRRWEVRYWLDDQVDQLFAKVSWEAFETDRKVNERLVEAERIFLERLVTCVPVTDAKWVHGRREQLEASAFRSLVVMQGLQKVDARVATARAQLAAGDPEAAVLSTKDAFGWAIDTLLDGHAEYGTLMKWRARRFRAAEPAMLTFQEYWAVETMRDYDPADPGAWVRRVTTLCQRVSMEVEI